MKEYSMKKIISERGQSLVELSISLMVLLWLLAGAVEFGLGFFQFIQLRDAAQEGALYGSINPNDTAGMINRVKAQSTSPIDLDSQYVSGAISGIQPGEVRVETAYVGGTNTGCITEGIEVTVAYSHKFFIPLATLFSSGNTITIKASVTDTILTDDIC